MNKYIYLYLLLPFLIIHTRSKAQEILSLNDALKLALTNNYSIQLSKNEAEINKNNNRLGAAGMLPTATGTATQDNQVVNTQQKFLNGSENNRNGAKSNQLNANIELGWTIFDGLKMFATKNKLAELQSIGELRLRSQIEQSFIRIIKAYYEIALIKQQIKVSSNALLVSEKRLQLVQDKYDAGKVAFNEVLKAKIDLNADKSAMMKQEAKLKNSKSTLNQLLARTVDVNFDVHDSISLNATLKLNELQSKAMSQNADIIASKKSQHLSALSIQEINAERMPSIQLKSGYNYSSQNSEAGFLQTSQNIGLHYGAALNINLFNGFEVNRRLQNAKINQRNSELIYKDSLLKLQSNLQQLYNTYIMNNELVTFEKENVNLAAQTFGISNDQYNAGSITALELREAQQNLLLSNNRYINAIYEAKLAELDLIRLSGDLGTYFTIN
jgi:outer membrane protein